MYNPKTILTLVLTLLISVSCNLLTSPDEELFIYKVTKIGDLTIEEFLQRETTFTKIYPSKFFFLKREAPYEGNVLFEPFGLKQMLSTCENCNSFSLDIKDEHVGWELIQIINPAFNEGEMYGMFVVTSPSIDGGITELFEATLIEN